MYVKLAPAEEKEIKEAVCARFEAAKGIYELLYYTCDNFNRNTDKVAAHIVEAYSKGTIFDLTRDIVYITNLCEEGAIYRMGQQYKLTPLELRTCCFIYWGFKWQQTCTVEALTENAYNVRCSRIRKKFSLEKEDRIPDFIARYCGKESIPSAQ